MVLSIGFHRVLRSQTISKGQPALEPLVSQIFRKSGKLHRPPEDRSCPNRILKNKGKNVWNRLRFLRTIMRKRTKGHFQNVLLRWPQEEHPLIPPFAVPVHVHTCMHTHTHTHTDSVPPSALVYGTVSQERPAGGCAGEAGFTGHLAGGVGGLPGKRCGQNLQSSLLQGRGSVCPWERWPWGCASPMGGKRQPALCQVTAS